jgi:hypothetical protein
MARSKGRTAKIELSAKGLERAASVEENNFVIVCGSSEIHSTKFHVAFISPRISEILRNDPMIERFILERIWTSCTFSRMKDPGMKRDGTCCEEQNITFGILTSWQRQSGDQELGNLAK